MNQSSNNQIITSYLASIGRRGGKKSKRVLSPATAREMAMVREAKRAFKKYYSECFWSFDPGLVITKEDVNWVAQRLMKFGTRRIWEVGRSLCL